MVKALPSVKRLYSASGKTVLLRLDTDVDLDKDSGKIVDDTRLKSGLETLSLLLKKGADVIIIGHLGRPDGEENGYSMKPIAEWFNKKYEGNLEKIKIGEFEGWEITPHLTILENIRFFKGEEENDKKFAKNLSLLGNLYVNDAFAVSHRSHASISGIPQYLPSYAGLHLISEVNTLKKIMENPKRPLAVVIGGAKIETKLPLVSKMHRIADYVLVGGEIAEQDRVLIAVQHEEIRGKKSVLLLGELDEEKTDMTQKSIENFKQIIKIASTVVWNGPLGVLNHKEERTRDTEWGTRQIARAIASSNAFSIIGGGDTISYLKELHLLKKFSFVSTGGGAMLEFLSGKELPGLKALEK